MKSRKGSVYPNIAAMGISLLLITSFFFPAIVGPSNKTDPAVMDFIDNVNWDDKHHIEFYGTLLNNLAEAYPKLATTYSIGHSWRERQLWCIEISSVSSKQTKTEVAVLGNIHGGEQESGASAAYVAWWLITNYDTDPKAKQILDDYIVYVVPVINPDGYENSFLYNTRSNFRPLDKDGNGYPCDDPRVDVDGDGIISRIYQGPESTTNMSELTNLGYESLDWNDDGILGNDVKESGIDLNRNFDYMWAAYDPELEPVLGERLTTSRRGPDVASEPEVNAVQDFLSAHSDIQALATLHTGEQSVLWPWCYTAEPSPDNEYMKATSEAMAAAFSESTGKNYYVNQSYDDYPTTAELIDFSYGRLGIDSYTVEVYARSGTYGWNNYEPSVTTWTYVGDWYGLEDIWLRQTTGGGLAYGDQHIVVEGCLQAMLVMFDSVPR
ncbi:hypothetical protein E4H04_10365 [Candidatus Bathyarchaeota archaeon]|nr:MAG: hypothetical protein E4H04_10365 [Candidatus Bathyarchaeota archaeon]